MRNIVLTILLVPAIGATAQQPAAAAPPEGSNWQHVQALPAGQSINVKARASSANCKLKSVDADTLTCTQNKDLIFQRADILTIKIPHRGRSALIGAAIGGGVGAGIGFAAGTNNNGGWFGPNFLRGAVTGIGAVFGGIVGGGTGAVTDFGRSTVYKAP
jgi:hypothetical protein